MACRRLRCSAKVLPTAGWSGAKLARPKSRSAAEVVVDGLEAALAEVGLVPERRALGVGAEILPPGLMRQRARPAQHGVHVPPVLPHSHVQREQPEEEAVVTGRPRGFASTEAWICAQRARAHAERDDDEVGMRGQIRGFADRLSRTRAVTPRVCAR